jgi:hypothetical protein
MGLASDVAALPPWAPEVEDVAAVVPSYTRGGFDDDSDVHAGEEQGTFTDTTSPTFDHVEGLIALACEEIGGRVDADIPEDLWGLAETTAKWHVAMSISAGKLPAQTDDAAGEFRAFQANYAASLGELDRAVWRRLVWVD